MTTAAKIADELADNRDEFIQAWALAQMSAGPLDAEDLSKGIIISEPAYDALRIAADKAIKQAN